MCFSAAANFVGSTALGAVGVLTLTKVKHRRELLFAALPILFAVHQFIEGFVWLGLDGIVSPVVAHNMGAAFMLYAQGLLPFLLPLGVLLFEPDGRSLPSRGGLLGVRRRGSFMLHRIHCGVCRGQKAFDFFTIVRIDSSANADRKRWPLAIMGYAVADAPRHKVGRLRARFR
jgi:hypothetical protein